MKTLKKQYFAQIPFLNNIKVLILLISCYGGLFLISESLQLKNNLFYSPVPTETLVNQDELEICDCYKRVRKSGRWTINKFGNKIWIPARLERVKTICPKSGFAFNHNPVG